MVGSAVKYMPVGNSQFAAVVYRRRVGDISLVVLKPVLYGAFVFNNLAGTYSHIAAVVYYLVPIMLQYLLCFHVLGIDHQSAGVAVQAVNDVCRTLLARLPEIVVKH